MDRRIIVLLVLAAIFICAAPIVGTVQFWTSATPETIVIQSALGLLTTTGIALCGVAFLALAAIASHLIDQPHQEAASPSDLPIDAQDTPQDPRVTTGGGEERRKSAISSYQLEQYRAWAATDDDVAAILESMDIERNYEIVDGPPTMTGDRYVPDLNIMFMYPHGARLALDAAKRAQDGELIVLSPTEDDVIMESSTSGDKSHEPDRPSQEQH